MASATIPLHSKSESLPSEVCHWSTDRLSDEAVRAIQTCRKHGQAAAQSAWRAGAYLSLLHARLIKGRKWATWLRQQEEVVTEHTARRYILLYERTGGRATDLDGMTLTEAYAAFGITRFTEIASSNESEPDHRYRLGSNGAHKLASIPTGNQVRDYLDPDDEDGILRAATVIRQQRNEERTREQFEKEEAARAKLNGKRTWTLTDDPKVVRCDLLDRRSAIRHHRRAVGARGCRGFQPGVEQAVGGVRGGFRGNLLVPAEALGRQEVVRRVAQGV